MSTTQYKFGLVFSGGGSRCIAQAGILKAMEEHGIQADIMSGTSGGAFIAALYAQGYSPDDILYFAKHYRMLDFLKPGFPRKGLFRNQKIAEELLGLFKVEKVDQLNIPVHILSTNITDMCQQDMYHESIDVALRAALSLPIIFRPVRHQGKLLVDGGVYSNLPVEPLLGKCAQILGLHVNPREQGDFSSLSDYIFRIIRMTLYANVIKNREHCDWMIEPEELASFFVLNFRKNEDEIFAIGYRHGHQFFEKHHQSIKS